MADGDHAGDQVVNDPTQEPPLPSFVARFRRPVGGGRALDPRAAFVFEQDQYGRKVASAA